MFLCDFYRTPGAKDKKKRKKKSLLERAKEAKHLLHSGGAIGAGVVAGDVLGDVGVIGGSLLAKGKNIKDPEFWKKVAKIKKLETKPGTIESLIEKQKVRAGKGTSPMMAKAKYLMGGIGSDIKRAAPLAAKLYIPVGKVATPLAGAGLGYLAMKAMSKKKKKREKSREYTFSPALSNFARTQGAKDKKKRKKRGLGKKLAIGAGLGVLGLTGAKYGIPAFKGGRLALGQVKRAGAPIRKNLKYIGESARGGIREQFGQDKALLQELVEKIKNRKADPLADVDTRNKLQKYFGEKWEQLVPDEAVRKPIEATVKGIKKSADVYTRGVYDVGRMVERGSNIKKNIQRRIEKVVGKPKKKRKKGKSWKPPWSSQKWEDREWSTT